MTLQFTKVLEKTRQSIFQEMSSFPQILKTHAVFVVILLLALFLRSWQLSEKMIFFADAGRDFLAAQQAIDQKQLPLLGIPSSVPRFRQGPLMVWIIIQTQLATGLNPLHVAWGMIIFSGLTLCLIYWIVRNSVSATAAYIASLFFAVSPLAIAHARMPYHISPIPLFTILFIYSLLKLDQKWSTKNLFLAVLSWGVLFQFELAVTPLFLVILWIGWKHKKKLKRSWQPLTLGLLVGLLPQLVFDLTHKFAHLGGFAIWVMYRIVASFGYRQDHQFSISRITETVDRFQLYWTRISTVDRPILSLIIIAIIIAITLIIIKHWKQATSFEKISVLSFSILSFAYFIHGSPSEAYFPPFLVFFPLLIGIAFQRLQKLELKRVFAMFLILLAFVNITNIRKNNFFVEPIASTFSYGPGLAEQEKVVQFIGKKVMDDSYQLLSVDEGAHFETYLNTYQYLAKWNGQQVISPQSDEIADHVFFIQITDQQALNNYPNSIVYQFPSLSIIQLK